MPILSSSVAGFRKCYLFSRTTNRRAKNGVSKNRRDYLYLFFFFNCTAKNKYNALK